MAIGQITAGEGAENVRGKLNSTISEVNSIPDLAENEIIIGDNAGDKVAKPLTEVGGENDLYKKSLSTFHKKVDKILFSDLFNRPDEAQITTADTGQSYVNLVGTSGFEIKNQFAVANTDGNFIGLEVPAALNSTSDTIVTECGILSSEGSSSNRGGVVLAAKDANNYLAIRISRNNLTLEYVKDGAAPVALLSTTTFVGDITAGQINNRIILFKFQYQISVTTRIIIQCDTLGILDGFIINDNFLQDNFNYVGLQNIGLGTRIGFFQTSIMNF